MENRKIIVNSGILYFRLIIVSFLGVFTAPILLKALGIEDFGLYAVVGGIVLMMNFLNTALITTSFRFIAFELGRGIAGDTNKIFNISLMLHVAMAVLLYLAAETLGVFYIKHYLQVAPGRLTEALFVFRISVVAAIFSILSIPFQALITAKENFSIRAIIEIIVAIARLGAAYLLLSFEGDRLLYYAQLMLGVSLLGPLAFTLYSKVKYKELTIFKVSKDWRTYKDFFSFSSWIMFGAGASIGKIQGTALVVNTYFGTTLNASFGLANQLNTFILMFAQNIGQAAIPQITKNYSAGNLERTKNITTVISKFSFFLMLIPAVPILLHTEFILTLWLKVLPDCIIIFCQLMIVNALIDSCSAGIPSAMQATGKIKNFQIILSVIMFLGLPVSYLLYYYNYPPETILVVFIGVSIVNTFIAQFFLKFSIGFNLKSYFNSVYRGIFQVLVLIFPLYFVADYFREDFYMVILFSLISTLWIVIAVFLVGLTKPEKSGVIISVKNIITRLFNIIK